MKLLAFLLIATALSAAIDSDMDGVDDANDRCMGTPFMDLVDATGCSTTSLISPHHIDVLAGVSYGRINDSAVAAKESYYSSLECDYMYRNFSAWIAIATYANSNDSGLADTFIGLNYRYDFSSQFSVTPYALIILPTYESGYHNEKTDFEAGGEVDFTHEHITLFASASYTQINDTDIDDISYQDIVALQAGTGYTFERGAYLSTSYYSADSMYVDEKDIHNLGLYMYLPLNAPWFLSAHYSYGLSDSDHFFSLRLGYSIR